MDKFKIFLLILLIVLIGVFTGLFLKELLWDYDFKKIDDNLNQQSTLPNFSKPEIYKQIIINGNKIDVEIADTIEKQVQGLSGRKKMADDKGMLFIFPSKEIRFFWMKNMNFPLDIIWINDNKIIGIEENLKPEGEKPEKQYGSPAPINEVLEVNAGFAEKNNLEIGDKVNFE